jgi:protein phosphatase 2C family protein 2/3
MSKKFEPLSLEKDIKYSYVSKPERPTKTLQATNHEKQNLQKHYSKNVSERLTDFNKNKNMKKKNQQKSENFPKQPRLTQVEKVQNENINIDNQPINYDIDENIPQGQIVEINDLIGEKCELDLEILDLPFNNFDQGKTSSKSMGIIRAYGANTYQGLVRNYNEDRVSIIINMNKPQNYDKKYWPKTSFFGIYDGHGGSKCADFLRDSLHKLIFNDENYPENVSEAIKNGFLKAENEFLNNYALDPSNNMNILDRSGSCAVIIVIVDTKIYIANVGDSRGVLSLNNGNQYIVVTEDHKPSNEKEKNRIIQSGGQVYQTQTPITGAENDVLNGQILLGPYRVLPGRLSVSRTIGDIEAKGIQFGGNPNVVIPYPDIYFYDLEKDNIDFLILGCDGIYDQISSEEILDCAWMIFKNKETNYNLHQKCGIIVDFILKASMARKSFDNITCVVVSLKDNFEDFTSIENNYNNINLNSIKNEKNTGQNLNEINDEYNAVPSVAVPKGSYNSLSQIRPTTSNNNIDINKNKIKGITLNAERSKKIKHINRITNNKKREKENNSKNKINKNNKTEIGNKTNVNNMKKILNKSEISHRETKKMESERTHSKKTFIKKMPHAKLIQSQNNLEYVHSPLEQRRSDMNVFKINNISNKISNNIRSNATHSNNNFLNKVSKYHYQYDTQKNKLSNLSSNSHKNGFVTMNNINHINHFNDKKKKIVNKSDLSCDNLIKNPLKNDKINKLKFTDIKQNKNRNDIKMKLQNNSGINSFRNNLHKNEFDSNSKSANQNFSNTSEKIRQDSSSQRRQSYHQILNNLNFHFNIQKQKTIKSGAMKKKHFIQTQRLTDKKISHSKGEELEMFLKRNLNGIKNKKLKLDINNNNNMNIKKIRSGIKYINSVGNKIVLDNSKNSLIINKFHNITQKNTNQKYSSSSLNTNSIRQQINGKFNFH